jgi:hypothetical protein
MNQRRSVTGNFRLHGWTQRLDQLRVIRMRRRIGEGGVADDPRGADGIGQASRLSLTLNPKTEIRGSYFGFRD